MQPSVQMVTSRLPMTLLGFEIAGIRLRSQHTLCLSLDADTYVGRTTYNLNAAQATGAQTAWNAQEEQGHRATAEALAMKAWKELEAAPAEPVFAGQPVRPVRLTMCLGPTVRQCATVSTVCATAGSTVTGPVSASLRTGAPDVTNPSLSVRPCSAPRTPDAHLPAKMEPNSNANAFPITKATANTASPSTRV